MLTYQQRHFNIIDELSIDEMAMKGVKTVDIFSENDQRQLLTIKGLRRLTRNDLAVQIGVSQPTMTKLINSPVPIALQSDVYKRFQNWLEKQTVATQHK